MQASRELLLFYLLLVAFSSSVVETLRSVKHLGILAVTLKA